MAECIHETVEWPEDWWVDPEELVPDPIERVVEYNWDAEGTVSEVWYYCRLCWKTVEPAYFANR